MLKVVTDSAADLPAGVVQELGITVVPLYVHFGQEVYRDGVDLAAGEFYQRLSTSPQFPTTSAPGPGVFAEAYEALVAQGHQVVSIHISGKLSATYQAALTASQDMGAGKVAVVDSQNVSLGTGLLVMAAARAAQEGHDLGQVVAGLQSAIPRAQMLFLLDTLEYLHKGGRIGRAQAFLGSLLNIKPILHIKEGEVHPLERARSRGKAISRLCEMVAARGPAQALGVIYTTTPQEAEEVASKLSPLVGDQGVTLAQVGSVLGVHGGPGALGVALIGAER
ncbi:MAG: DegV family protein [Chloroflexota bacterium]